MATRVGAKAERTGDMHPNRKLRITETSDGDITVSIMQDGWPMGEIDTGNVADYAASVQFTSSGGRSPRVRAAFMGLLVAMEQENEERPIR